ncbi:SAWADEE HOMEODOMAIN-like protein 2 [Nymphaea thermarum]|nr:SAWADEE HOMEODOMAIN-like protein 2 [Nymphaea thermarum]
MTWLLAAIMDVARMAMAVLEFNVQNSFESKQHASKAKDASFALNEENSVPDTCQEGNVETAAIVPLGDKIPDLSELEFEARSAKDGAWYDVAMFLAHRVLDSGEPEVRVRFAGFGAIEDEWVNVKRAVRQRSLPLEPSECTRIKPGDLVLCFREGKEQALYFDAHVVEVEKKRHDIRGCRCCFLVRYVHDKTMEKVSLRRLCSRPTVPTDPGLGQV